MRRNLHEGSIGGAAGHSLLFLADLDEFLLTSVQVWEKNSDLKNLTKS
jgi:hypothetical protein